MKKDLIITLTMCPLNVEELQWKEDKTITMTKKTVTLKNKLNFELEVSEAGLQMNNKAFDELLYQDFKLAIKSKITEKELRKAFDIMLNEARKNIIITD